jgi:hypothetical protein
VFFDLLSPELNLDGVVFFFQSIFPSIVNQIEKHFAPVETALKSVTGQGAFDGPMGSVLRKTYQGNWKSIHQQCLSHSFNESVM